MKKKKDFRQYLYPLCLAGIAVMLVLLIVVSMMEF